MNQTRDFFKTLRRKNAAVNVQRFLDAGVSIEERDAAGRTALMIAARYGNAELVNMLLEAGAEVEARDNEGLTPLLHALTYNVMHPKVTERLLQAGAAVNVPHIFENKIVYTDALDIAASRGNVGILRLLMEFGANVRDRADKGFSLLRSAIGSADAFFALLEAGADIHGGDPARLLLDSIVCYSATVADWLRAQGVSLSLEAVQHRDATGYPTLLEALGGTTEPEAVEKTIRLLLRLGADVNAQDGNGLYTPLTLAIVHGHALPVIRLLLEAGADVNYAFRGRGETALSCAILYRPSRIGNRPPESDLLSLLLEVGANPNPPLSPGKPTPLYYALIWGWDEATRLLLAAGAELSQAVANHGDSERYWYFARALRSGQSISAPTILLYECLRCIPTPYNLRLLLEAGAEVNCADDAGITPLMHACSRSCAPALIPVLLAAGADIFARDSENQTPYDYAKKSEHAEAALALLRAEEHKLYPHAAHE